MTNHVTNHVTGLGAHVTTHVTNHVADHVTDHVNCFTAEGPGGWPAGEGDKRQHYNHSLH